MDDRAMVTSGSRYSLTGTRDGVDDTVVPAPHGGGLPTLVTCVRNREGESSSGGKKGGGAVTWGKVVAQWPY
jgi:hypothetical protein